MPATTVAETPQKPSFNGSQDSPRMRTDQYFEDFSKRLDKPLFTPVL
jgi:hypothetical protein